MSRDSSLAPNGSVLRLPLLRDVHRRQDLEDVQNGVAGGPVEGLGGVEDAVDPVADRELFGARLEVDVGRPAEDRVVDQLLGRAVGLRLFRPLDPLGVGLLRPLGLADEDDRRAGLAPLVVAFVEDPAHPHPVHEVIGDLAEVVGREDLGLVGDRLVPDVDVVEQGDEVREQEQAQAHGVDRDRPDQGEAEDPGREGDRVPHLEAVVVQLAAVVVDPPGRPGPEQVDRQDRDELEEVEVEARPPLDVGRLCHQGEIAQVQAEAHARAEPAEGVGRVGTRGHAEGHQGER